MPPKKAPLRFVTAFGEYSALPSAILGQGGSGTVYRATDPAGETVAVKVLNPGTATKEKARRFKNEILFGLDARHPRVLRILDHGSISMPEGDASFYVMPYYEQTLRGLIAKGIPAAQVLPLFSTLLDGVEAAHLKKVVHRDLKPENVLYDAAGPALIVTDFGVAHFEDEERFTVVETKPGTRLANFQYAAPEQRVRDGAVDQRADIYALGLMLNEMFTGIVPHGTDYQTVAAAAPEYAFVDTLVAAMIRQQAPARPASIDDVKQQLQAAHQEFVIRQKVHELEKTVVPVTEIVDPLLDDPIRITGLSATAPDTIVLRLNQPLPMKWVQVARSTHGYSYTPGHDPKVYLRPGAGELQIQEPAFVLQNVIDSLKALIAKANRQYPEALRQEAEQQRQEVQRQLREQAAQERARLELQQRLRI